VLLCGVVGEVEGSAVGCVGLALLAEVAEEFGAGGVVEVVAVECFGEGVEFGEGWAGAEYVAEGDGAVEADERGRVKVQQHVLEPRNARKHRRDRRVAVTDVRNRP
jgi:hypothetical protein